MLKELIQRYFGSSPATVEQAMAPFQTIKGSLEQVVDKSNLLIADGFQKIAEIESVINVAQNQIEAANHNLALLGNFITNTEIPEDFDEWLEPEGEVPADAESEVK